MMNEIFYHINNLNSSKIQFHQVSGWGSAPPASGDLRQLVGGCIAHLTLLEDDWTSTKIAIVAPL